MPTPSNPDAPAFPPLAGMSDLAMQGMTKRELVAAELFTRNRERYALCPDLAWKEADHFFAADPRNGEWRAHLSQYIADIEADEKRMRSAFAAVVDAAFPEGLAEIETSRRVALTVDRIRELMGGREVAP